MISIIIPIYKVSQYLDECVKSIVSQTYKNLEIILVDDGSPDECPRMCDEWAKKDGRIKVVHKKNGGLSSARNAGLKVAKGEYIGFVDSDDYVDETMYEDLMRVMNLDEKTMVVSSPIIRNTNGVFTPYLVGSYVYEDGDTMSFAEYMKKFLRLKMDATVWNKLFRREFVHTYFREGRNNEDYLFMYYNVKNVYNTQYLIAVTSKPHYYYRDNAQSICHQAATSVNRLFFDEIYNIVEISEDLKKWNPVMNNQIVPMLEGKIIHASDQILKYPVLREKRFVDCQFIDTILKKDIHLFRKGRPFANSLTLFLFQYFPGVYLLTSRFFN